MSGSEVRKSAAALSGGGKELTLRYLSGALAVLGPTMARIRNQRTNQTAAWQGRYR